MDQGRTAVRHGSPNRDHRLDGETRRTAQIRNASSWGFAIEMQSPVAPGASLERIEMEDGEVLGKASYCREVAGSYYSA